MSKEKGEITSTVMPYSPTTAFTFEPEAGSPPSPTRNKREPPLLTNDFNSSISCSVNLQKNTQQL